MKKSVTRITPHAYMLDKNLAEQIFLDKPSMFYKKIDGIREQIKKGRYPQLVLVDERRILVNLYAYYDYSIYRSRLEDRHLAKTVDPFEPEEINKLFPAVKEMIVIPESEITGGERFAVYKSN